MLFETFTEETIISLMERVKQEPIYVLKMIYYDKNKDKFRVVDKFIGSKEGLRKVAEMEND